MKTKHDNTESNHTLLKKVVAKQRDEIHELKKHNERLQQGSAACRRVMQELRGNITTLSNANDVQTIELDEFRQKQRDEHAAREWKQAD
jgi:hypothetical protein